MKGKKLALLAMLVSVALVLHVVESLLPIPHIAPGVAGAGQYSIPYDHSHIWS